MAGRIIDQHGCSRAWHQGPRVQRYRHSIMTRLRMPSAGQERQWQVHHVPTQPNRWCGEYTRNGTVANFYLTEILATYTCTTESSRKDDISLKFPMRMQLYNDNLGPTSTAVNIGWVRRGGRYWLWHGSVEYEFDVSVGLGWRKCEGGGFASELYPSQVFGGKPVCSTTHMHSVISEQKPLK